MHFNVHSKLVGSHAFLSPSSYHWVNYDEEKLDQMFLASMAAKRGSDLHAFAHEAIRLGQRLPDTKQTVNLYVNDGIGYKMTTEQVLFYTMNCYGAADSIAFRHSVLKISDLKTGVTQASSMQLKVYAALFCLEYKHNPFNITTELRIYQNDDVVLYDGDPDEIMHIIDKIRMFDKRISEMTMEVML